MSNITFESKRPALRRTLIVRAIPIFAGIAAAWYGYLYWMGTPQQVAIRTVSAFLNNEASTVFDNGLQRDLVIPSYSSTSLGAFIDLAEFSSERVVGIDEVTPESLTHKGFRVRTESGKEYSVNLVKTAFGWRFNDLSFLVTQLRKTGRRDPSVYQRVADYMQREGIQMLYQPEGRRAATVSGVREGIIWTAAERRRFKWE